jgi:MFS family permease
LLTFFIQGFVTTTTIPRVPELISQIDVSFAQWGLIIGISGAGSLLPLMFTHRLVNRFGTRLVVRVSSVAIALIVMSLAFATDPLLFFILYAGQSFIFSIFNISLNAQAVMLQKKIKRVVIGRFHGAWSLGATISAAVSGILSPFLPLFWHLIIIPLLCGLAFFFVTRLMLSPTQDGHASEREASGKSPNWFKSPTMLWIIALGNFAGMWPELVMMDWSAIFARDSMGLDLARGAIPYTVFTGAMIIGRMSIGRVTKRIHISDMSRLGGIFGSIAMLAGLILGPLISSYDESLGLLVLSILWGISGLGVASMVPSFMSAAGYVKGLTTAQALSRMSMVNVLLVMGAKILMGALTQAFTIVLAYLFPIGMLFIAGLLAGKVAREAKRSDAVANAFPQTGAISTIDS